ncbi:hypothetical protein EXS74_02710 [Candidatus Woesearchaeota archaeon]|nr:hypothetical protein [Candidatus Woesearchaeota archaeon]
MKKKKGDCMGDKKLLFVIAALILTVSLFFIPNPELTGFTTSQATESPITIYLDTTIFATNSPITGTINLTLSETLDPSEPLTISLNSHTYTYTIEQLLQDANLSLEYETTQFNATNAASQKSVSFTSAGTKFLGLKTPRYAEVSDISYTLTATSIDGINPSAVAMDFGNEGTIDWYYLGSFMNYNSTRIKSPDLDTTVESTGYIEAETYYCEFLDLPRTKDITISANYTTSTSGGDLQAVILSVPTGKPGVGWSGGSDTCDLPESGTKSCVINLEYTIEGQYLVCIYTEGEDDENYYEIPLDSSAETQTAYTCPTSVNSVCQETAFNNFFIYTQAGIYNNNLSSTVSVETWETFTGSMLTAIKYYVGSYPYSGLCKTTTCTIPLNISSQTAGNLTFSDLSLIYDYNGITQSSNSFYDLELPTADITAIDGQVLEDGATIEIALDTLNLSEASIGDYSLDASFMNTSVSYSISILNASDIQDATTLIYTATTKLNAFLDQNSQEYQILSLLGKIQDIEGVLEDLDTSKNKIGFTEESLLVSEIENSLADIPWQVSSTETKSKTITTGEKDIPSSLGDSTDILAMQNSISVKATLNAVSVETYNLEKSTYILVKKEITANEDINGATLYELYPLAFSDLLSSERPTASSGTQAEFSIDMSEGETTEFYYITTEAVSLSDFKSIIITEITQEEPIIEETSNCGDYVCDIDEDSDSCPQDCGSEFNWLYVIIPVAVVLILVGLFLGRKMFVKKKEGTTNNTLVSFFQKGTAKGIKKEELINDLRKKGWKEPDIQAALKNAKV